jgi:hypothetical protein
MVFRFACPFNTLSMVAVNGSSGGTTNIICGTEISWYDAGTQPTITYSAAGNGYYTLLIVDRDAPSPWDPNRAPM